MKNLTTDTRLILIGARLSEQSDYLDYILSENKNDIRLASISNELISVIKHIDNYLNKR